MEPCQERIIQHYVKILFMDVSSISSLDADETDSLDADETDLDKLMNDSQADGCVVHGKHLVYHATFTIEICKEITRTANAEERLNLSYNFSSLALEGAKQVANSDSCRRMSQLCTQLIIIVKYIFKAHFLSLPSEEEE
jgi:hypothetical protein